MKKKYLVRLADIDWGQSNFPDTLITIEAKSDKEAVKKARTYETYREYLLSVIERDSGRRVFIGP